ncbi:hypothetical protein [Crateriforma conspicua]|uniref:Uncharacterized protein n=1 Tax=Crateriforma conspicua TaxID=2527996 RepID=A0A5C5Y6X5_9PLAN|nr:hypothetical protein [Crateriforma conspicua]QDV65533.1 hypothetical protein Mal65_47040 [Crateriforma conspicua]TWT70924.1 hypothetical protein Pan14r_32320 [Crateriforma conspicua]
MHRIRLRKPWLKATTASFLDDQPLGVDAFKSDVPDTDTSVLPSGTDEFLVYQRTFNRPTGIADATRVHLQIDRWAGHLVGVDLNGEVLAHDIAQTDAPLRIDVTSSLQTGNRLRIGLLATDQQALLSGEVYLLIENNSSNPA